MKLWFKSLFHRAPIYDYAKARFVYNPIRKWINRWFYR